jgi:GxxExxY protein
LGVKDSKPWHPVFSPKTFYQTPPLMPVHFPVTTHRISQERFKMLSSEVMDHVFAIHHDFGRFFDEIVYKRELADRMSGAVLELEIILTHGSFSKLYYVDVLINHSGLFEFKAADAIHPRHRGQTLNYLLLLDLAHGKVINMRPESVGHEFVNCPARLVNLKNPRIDDTRLSRQIAGAEALRDTLMPLITDWGAGLETALYEEAITHFLGGEDKVLMPVPVMGPKGHLANQRMRLAAPGAAFKLTALQDRFDDFERHALRLLRHTDLTAIHWINITQNSIRFTTLT